MTKRLRFDELPPLMTLPQVAAYLGKSRWWVAQRVNAEREVVELGGGKELPVFREASQWRCWRATLGDVFGEQEKRAG